MHKTINIASDFTVFPGGRYPADGDFSGEEFRDNILAPALESNDFVTVELDGTRGYGSSFLEETFGGLFRRYPGLTLTDIRRKLKLVSARPSLIREIEGYMEAAAN